MELNQFDTDLANIAENYDAKEDVLATYLQGYGDLLVSTNKWDPAVLERFRADAVG